FVRAVPSRHRVLAGGDEVQRPTVQWMLGKYLTRGSSDGRRQATIDRETCLAGGRTRRAAGAAIDAAAGVAIGRALLVEHRAVGHRQQVVEAVALLREHRHPDADIEAND